MGRVNKNIELLQDRVALDYAMSWVLWTPSNCDLRATKLNPDFWVSAPYKFASYLAQQLYAEEMGWA